MQSALAVLCSLQGQRYALLQAGSRPALRTVQAGILLREQHKADPAWGVIQLHVPRAHTASRPSTGLQGAGGVRPHQGRTGQQHRVHYHARPG